MALAAQVNTLVVNMNDGSTTMFRLIDAPVITYSDNNLVVKTASKEASLPVADIKNVTLEDHSVATAIDPSTITDNGIVFRELPAGSVIRVMTADGKSVCTKTVDGGDDATLDFSELPKGVLIISTPVTTIKVNNK